MDYSHFFSEAVPTKHSHVTVQIRNLVMYGPPLPYNLSFGTPNPETFPFQKARVTLKDGIKFDIDPELMKVTLQYGHMQGYRPLLEHLKTLILHLHDPPHWSDRDVLMTTGSLQGLGKVFEVLLNEGDSLFIPSHCYHGVFVASRHLLPNYVSVETDAEGLVPESFKEALMQCKASKGIPKLLYVNPSGSNPTGTVLPESRRRVIYDLACQYDVIILEDDPYYFMQYSDRFPSSFLRIDTECRVIRLESFSKTLGAGMRLGYMTAPKPVLKVILQLLSAATLHSSSLPQVMVSRLFDIWGQKKFLEEAKKGQKLYKNLRDITIEAAEKHLKDVCEWTVPAGGFYLWLKVPKLRDTTKVLLECGRKKNVVLVPGSGFCADSTAPSQYMRASYATTNREEVDKGFQILAESIREAIKQNES